MRRARGLCACCALGVLVLAASSGCSPAASDEVPGLETAQPDGTGSLPQARVLVTTGFGAVTVLDEVVPLEDGLTAMEALHLVAEVGTEYGGGFVQSINGIGAEHESRVDWFYTVNGILADKGAASHALQDGDVEHWDYRVWGFRRNVGATLGCFPSFFARGYGADVRPTFIAYEAAFLNEASAIADALLSDGVREVETAELASVTEERMQQCNLVIVAGSEHDVIREVYSHWDRLGLFTLLEGAELRVYDAAGDEAVVFGEGTGVIDAVQNPWNPSGTGACESVVLLVSGTDEEGVRAAALALVESCSGMTAWCGAVVQGGVAVPAPLPAA